MLLCTKNFASCTFGRPVPSAVLYLRPSCTFGRPVPSAVRLQLFPPLVYLQSCGRQDFASPLETDDKRSALHQGCIWDILSYSVTKLIHLAVCLTTGPKPPQKASSPHSAIQSFLLQMTVSSPFLKVIQ